MNGKEGRDAGMAQALASAESKIPSWGDKAYQALLDYPHPQFMTEDVRKWAHEEGLEKPPQARAWGAVIARAKKEGEIIPIGFKAVKNPRAHRTPATHWQKTS
jgi:hypothetical protein